MTNSSGAKAQKSDAFQLVLDPYPGVVSALGQLANTSGESSLRPEDEGYYLAWLPFFLKISAALESVRQSENVDDLLRVYEATTYVVNTRVGNHFGLLPSMAEWMAPSFDPSAFEDAFEGFTEWERSLGEPTRAEWWGGINAVRENWSRDRRGCQDAVLLLTFCSAVQYLRKLPDSTNSPSNFIRKEVFAGHFVNEPIAHFFKALGTFDKSSSDAELLSGATYARAAIAHYAQAPGALNLGARYNILLASQSPAVQDVLTDPSGGSPRSQLLFQAVEWASRAILSDPDYPEYFGTRAEANFLLGKPRAAQLDYDTAIERASVSSRFKEKQRRLKEGREKLQDRKTLEEFAREAGRVQEEARKLVQQLEDVKVRTEEVRAAQNQVEAVKQETLSLRREVQRQRDDFQSKMADQQREQIQILGFIAAALALITVGAGAVQNVSDKSLGSTVLVLVIWVLGLLGILLVGGLILSRRRAASKRTPASASVDAGGDDESPTSR